MSRARLSLRELAGRVGLDADDLRTYLRDHGIGLRGTHDRIARADTMKAGRLANELADSLHEAAVAARRAAQAAGGTKAETPNMGSVAQWPSEGEVLRGKVSKVMDYGAFVELAPGVEGLVHVSELAHHAVANPRKVVAEGDEVEVLVLHVDRAKHRIALSMSGATPLAVPPKTPSSARRPRAEEGFPDWRRIGQDQPLEHLTASQLEAIHWQIVDDFAEQNDTISGGVRTRALLESTAFRPHTSLAGVAKYPTAAMAGAALFHSVVHNHAFHDGNKRTALVSLIAFLQTNGWLLQSEEEELYAYVLRVAEHRVCDGYDPTDSTSADKEVQTIAEWLNERLRKVQKGEFVVQWRVLQGILASYGCEFKMPRRGNRMNIVREGKKSQIQYTGDGMDVERNTIHKIRRDLELDEDHGVDSQAFYRGDARIPDFINRYRKILDKLAEYDRERDAAERV